MIKVKFEQFLNFFRESLVIDIQKRSPIIYTIRLEGSGTELIIQLDKEQFSELKEKINKEN